MDRKDWAVYHGLIAAARYEPTTQLIHFNESALSLLNLPSSTNLAEFIEIVTPSMWQQICQLQHGQSKLIGWPIAASQPSHWFLWTAAHANTKHATLFFQITDQTSLGHTTIHWQNQAQLAAVGRGWPRLARRWLECAMRLINPSMLCVYAFTAYKPCIRVMVSIKLTNT